ncbi:MAG: magnesium transporter, partial [Mycobacterium sp.]|nr:magnesium transporter [Mycobacterium sp.]
MSARSGDVVGRVDDVIVQLRHEPDYPLVTGIVARIGGRRIFVASGSVETYAPGKVVLAQNKVDLRAFERRDPEVLLRADVLGHRLIDVAAVELVRAYDLELEDTSQGWVLARVDTRRPPRLFGLIRGSGGHAARDWKAFEPLIGDARTRALRKFSGRMGSLKPAELADLIEEADSDEGGEILDRVRIDPELEADVFEELDPDKAGRLLNEMPDTEVAALLGRMCADDAADAIFDLRQPRRRQVLDLMPALQRAKVTTLLGFNPQSAGGLMNVDTISCPTTATAGDALALISAAHGIQPEALLKVHVLDPEKRLVGVVSVIALLQASPNESVVALMDSDPVRIRVDAD